VTIKPPAVDIRPAAHRTAEPDLHSADLLRDQRVKADVKSALLAAGHQEYWQAWSGR